MQGTLFAELVRTAATRQSINPSVRPAVTVCSSDDAAVSSVVAAVVGDVIPVVAAPVVAVPIVPVPVVLVPVVAVPV